MMRISPGTTVNSRRYDCWRKQPLPSPVSCAPSPGLCGSLQAKYERVKECVNEWVRTEENRKTSDIMFFLSFVLNGGGGEDGRTGQCESHGKARKQARGGTSEKHHRSIAEKGHVLCVTRSGAARDTARLRHRVHFSSAAETVDSTSWVKNSTSRSSHSHSQQSQLSPQALTQAQTQTWTQVTGEDQHRYEHCGSSNA